MHVRADWQVTRTVLLFFHVLYNAISPELHGFLDIDDPLARFGLRESSVQGLNLVTGTYRKHPGNGGGTFSKHSKVINEIPFAGIRILRV